MGLRSFIDGLFGSKMDESLRQSQTSETPDSDPRDDEPELPYEPEYERVDKLTNETLSDRFDRSVELVFFVDGNAMLIEYDTKEQSGSTTEYCGYSGCSGDVGKWYGVYLDLSFDEQVVTVNERNVSHRNTLGSYVVTVERDAKISNIWWEIQNADEIPECCMMHGKPIERSTWQRDDEYVVRPRAFRTDGLTFQHGPDQSLIYGVQREFESWTSDTRIEHEGSTAEIIAGSVETGTEVMQAATADGTVIVPDHVQGLGNGEGGGGEDGGSSDLMRIADVIGDSKN